MLGAEVEVVEEKEVLWVTSFEGIVPNNCQQFSQTRE